MKIYSQEDVDKIIQDVILRVNRQRNKDLLQLQKELKEILSHEEEPRGIDGSYHEGWYDKKQTFRYDKDCKRCQIDSVFDKFKEELK